MMASIKQALFHKGLSSYYRTAEYHKLMRAGFSRSPVSSLAPLHHIRSKLKRAALLNPQNHNTGLSRKRSTLIQTVFSTKNKQCQLQLSVRKAKFEDYEHISQLKPNDMFDYVTSNYHRYLCDPRRSIYIAESDGQVVGLSMTLLVDEGNAFVQQGARILPEYKERGVMQEMSRITTEDFCTTHPKARRMLWTSNNLQEIENFIRKNKTAKMVCIRPRVAFDTTPAEIQALVSSIKFKTLCEDLKAQGTQILSPRDGALALEKDVPDPRSLAPEGIFVSNSEPFGFYPRNYRDMLRGKDVLVTYCDSPDGDSKSSVVDGSQVFRGRTAPDSGDSEDAQSKGESDLGGGVSTSTDVDTQPPSSDTRKSSSGDRSIEAISFAAVDKVRYGHMVRQDAYVNVDSSRITPLLKSHLLTCLGALAKRCTYPVSYGMYVPPYADMEALREFTENTLGFRREVSLDLSLHCVEMIIDRH